MVVIAILLALVLAGCGSPARNSADAHSKLGAERPANAEARAEREVPCIYPNGTVLMIEKRLEPTEFVKPEYPQNAKRLHIQGPVEVTMLVDQNGDVVWACGKGDPALTGAAEQAARRCTFPKNFGSQKPWTSGRTPVVLTFDFRLRGQAQRPARGDSGSSADQQ